MSGCHLEGMKDNDNIIIRFMLLLGGRLWYVMGDYIPLVNEEQIGSIKQMLNLQLDPEDLILLR